MKWVHHTIIMSAILAFFVWISLTPPSNQKGVYFPWQITTLEGGNSSVFGLTLGKSTLADVLALSHDKTLAIFYIPGKPLRLEAYLPSFKTGPLIAKLIAEIEVETTLLEETYEAYEVHRKPINNNGFKVELPTGNVPKLLTSTITSLSYSPTANLSKEIISEKFGKPDQIISENDDISHWIYAKKGLAIAYNESGRELFQYLPPKNFTRLMDKLTGTKKQPK